MFDWQFSDLHYIKIKLTLTAYKLLCRCRTSKCEVLLESYTQGLRIVTHPNQTDSMFDQHFSDLHYIKIKLTLTAYKLLCRCSTLKCEVSLKSYTQGLFIYA